MKRAFFKFDDILLGTLVYDEETGNGSFFYTVCSWQVDNLKGIRPSILMEILESVRHDVKEKNFNYEEYISKYNTIGLHFEEDK